MDADVRFKGRRIEHGGTLPISDLSTHVILERGDLRLQPLRLGLANGTIAGSIHLEGDKKPLQGTANLQARRLKLKALMPNVEMMQKTLGEMNGDVQLRGTGNSVAALLGNSNGNLKLLMNDGLISRNLMEILGLNVGNFIIGQIFGDDEVRVNCAAANIDVVNGVARPQVFAFDTENALINVTGTASFASEQLDLTIDPESKGFRIITLRSPLYVRGTFKSPNAGVKAGPLIARGAVAAALATLVTPAAALLALISPAEGEANQCRAILSQMKNSRQGDAAGRMARGVEGELQRLMTRFVSQQQRDHRQRRHGGQIEPYRRQTVVALQPGGDVRRHGCPEDRRDVIGERCAGIANFRREQLRQQRAHGAKGQPHQAQANQQEGKDQQRVAGAEQRFKGKQREEDDQGRNHDHALTTAECIRQQARHRYHHAKTDNRHHQHPQHFVTRQAEANRRGGGAEGHGVDGHDVKQRIGRQHDKGAENGDAHVFGQQRAQRDFDLFFRGGYLSEHRRLVQRNADVQADNDQHGGEDKRHTPAPFHKLLVGQQPGEQQEGAVREEEADRRAQLRE